MYDYCTGLGGQLKATPEALRPLLVPLCSLVFLRLFKTLARAKIHETEALLISIGSTNAQPKVTDACPTKMDADIMPSSVGLLAVGYPVIYLQGHKTPNHWSQLDLLITPQFPSEEIFS
jgi:hypothetical protein